MIYELLEVGAENAKPAKELAKLLGCDRRAVSAMVQAERRQGIPICASCNGKNPGYYIAPDRETMQGYCNGLLHRMGEIAKTRKACMKMMNSLPAAGGAGNDAGTV